MYVGSFSFYHYSPLRAWTRILRSQEQKTKIVGASLVLTVILLQSMVVHQTYIDAEAGRSVLVKVGPLSHQIPSTGDSHLYLTSSKIKGFLKYFDRKTELNSSSSSSLFPVTDERHVIKILIAGSYTGEPSILETLLEKHAGSFYWREPLFGLHRAFVNSSGVERSLVHYGYDVTGTMPENKTNVLHIMGLHALCDVMNCNMTCLPRDIVEHNFLYASTNPSIGPYKSCLQDHAPISPPELTSMCLPLLENGCNASHIRAIKTARLSLRFISDVMSRDTSIRVIHVVRDPRVVMQIRNVSQERLGDVLSSICDAMSQDATTYEVLVKLYPQRIILVKFESLFLEPAALFQVLSFTGLTEQASNSSFMTEVLNAHDQVAMWNVTDIVNRWRQQLPADDITKMTMSCRKVLDYLGYDIDV